MQPPSHGDGSPVRTMGSSPETVAPGDSRQASGAGAIDVPPSHSIRLMHGLLIALACIVALGLLLILVPDGGFDRLIRSLRATRAADIPDERIALLYLGDELKAGQFHIRGIVRNIDREAIERIDASLRLYGSDGSLLETAIVRFDRESIDPDETAEFHLTYPKYAGQFGSYSVDFRMRDGELVPYKDRRGTRHLQ